MDAARYLALVKSWWWLLLHRMVIAAGAYAPTYGLPGATLNRESSIARVGPLKLHRGEARADLREHTEAELRPMERRAG
jgi:hypothetical protein